VEVLLGILGLALALYQIRRAEKAALAAKNAIESSMRQGNTYTLLLLIPEVAIIERELDRLAAADLLDETVRLIRDWQSRASELQGLLREQELDLDALETKVQESLVLASLARGTLSKASAKPSTATKRLREVSGDVVVLARTEAAQIRARLPGVQRVPTLREDLRSLTHFLMKR